MEGVFKSKRGKQVRVVYLPLTSKVSSRWKWTVLGKRKKWFKTKTNAIKYAVR
jgi:hypothetical protein